MVKDILHLQNLEALNGLGTAFEALLAIDSTRTGGDVVDCFIKFIEYAANATFPSNSSSEAPAVATGPRSALKMKYWNLLAYLSVTDAPTIDTILQTKVDLSTLYLQSKDDSAERHEALPILKLFLYMLCSTRGPSWKSGQNAELLRFYAV